MTAIFNKLELHFSENESHWNSDTHKVFALNKSLSIARMFLCALDEQFLTSLRDSTIMKLVQISNETVVCASHVSKTVHKSKYQRMIRIVLLVYGKYLLLLCSIWRAFYFGNKVCTLSDNWIWYTCIPSVIFRYVMFILDRNIKATRVGVGY